MAKHTVNFYETDGDRIELEIDGKSWVGTREQIVIDGKSWGVLEIIWWIANPQPADCPECGPDGHDERKNA